MIFSEYWLHALNYFSDIPHHRHKFSDSQTTDSSTSQDPLAEHIYQRDQNDIDEGMRDSRLFSFKPCLPPGIQFGFVIRQTNRVFQKPVDFYLLFLTREIMLEICIATNHHAQALISKCQNLSYANSRGHGQGSLLKRCTERDWSTCPLYNNNNMVSGVKI